MKKDNRGVTLVELVISIAIIGILAGFFISSMNYVGNTQARGLANAIKTSVGQTKIQTMGKYKTFLYIYRNSTDKKYYKETWRRSNEEGFVREKTELIGKNRPVVKFYTGSTEHVINGVDRDGLLITFDRSSGKEKAGEKIEPVSSLKDSEGNSITLTTKDGQLMPDESVSCNKIEVSYGNAKYEIKIVPETGKISL